MPEWLVLIGRTLLTYFFLLVILRLMGGREIAKLSVFDLVVSIMIAEVAAIGIENFDKPFYIVAIPVLTLMLTQIMFTVISMHSKKIRDLVEGKAVVVIENGRFRDHILRRYRLSIDDILAQLREKGIADIGEVDKAVLETSGKLSIFPKEEKLPVTREDLKLILPYEGLSIPLIMDGRVLDKNLEEVGKTRFWLKNKIQEKGCHDFKDVFYASINAQGEVHVDPRDPPKTLH